MSAQLKLADANISSLFTISHQDWLAINYRASAVVGLQAIRNYVSQFILNYSDLLAVSLKWQTTTYPDIKHYASALVNYAEDATMAFSKLQSDISGLSPTDQLTPALKGEATQAIKKLHDQTEALSTQFNALNTDIAAFSDQNMIADAKVKELIQKFGPQWQDLTQVITAVDNATGHVRGAWQAINDDLKAIAKDEIDMTMQVLLELDIQSALLAWQDIKKEASDFISEAA